MRLKIAYKSVDALIPYINNAKVHGDEQIDMIAASIKEFGFNNPVLLDGENGIIAGHGRLQGAKKLEMDKVPTIELSHLTEAQKKQYILADNRLGEVHTEWDLSMVAAELNSIDELGGDIVLTGFDDSFLFDPASSDEKGTEDDAPDVPVNPASLKGDIWLCGDHRVMCGDSTIGDDVSALMDGALADMLLTDPPYNVAYVGKTKKSLTIENDEMNDESFRQFLVDAFVCADSNLKPGGVFYIWHADSEGYNFRGACSDVSWKVRQCLIWKKQTMVMGRQDYHWKHEPCLYGWKEGSGHLWASDRKQTTILEFDRPSKNEEHPTMKPVELFEYQVLNNTKGKDIVLDLFGGSGTTVIACEKNGRQSRVMEMDPKYVDVIVKRWQEYSGSKAKLLSNGKTFDAMSKQRLKSKKAA